MNSSELELQNVWWKGDCSGDFHLHRLRSNKYIYLPASTLCSELEQEQQGIYTLIGPRQIGKTTYLKLLIQKLLEKHSPLSLFYFSCENMTKEALREVLFFYLREIAPKKGKRFIFLDEVSLVENWELVELELYNKGLLEEVIIINSGSSSLNLKKSAERLPGRKGKGRTLYLLPLSFREFVFLIDPQAEEVDKNPLAFLDTLQKHLHHYVLASGFPYLINAYFRGKIEDNAYDIYKDWIEGEIAKAGRSIQTAHQIFARLLVSRTSLVNWDSLAQQCSIKSHKTVAEYVDLFDSLFMVKVLYQIEEDLRVKYAKNKKIYFLDHFLFSVLEKSTLQINNYFDYYQQKIKDNDYFSKIIENIAFSNLFKLILEKGYGINNTLFFWRSKTQQEIDFLVKVQRGTEKIVVPLEVKYSNRVEPSRLKTFRPIILSKDTYNPKYSIFPVALVLFKLEEYVKI